MMSQSSKAFLFLQGPHGPFFRQLGRMLRQAGARVWRVGFNAGDAAFWWRDAGYIPFQGDITDWPDALATLLRERQITDLVLYGDTRPIHAEAIRQAKAAGVRIHVFEEGYLRPYWVTYERDGSNGHSRLMQFSVTEMRNRLAQSDIEMPTPPAHWGTCGSISFTGLCTTGSSCSGTVAIRGLRRIAPCPYAPKHSCTQGACC